MVGQTAEKTKPITVIYNFFKQFPKWCGKSPVTPTTDELEKYLAKSVQMFNNGNLIVKSAADYLNRLKKFQKKYVDFKISEPLEEPLVVGNKATIYYRLDLTTSTGQHKEVFIMGLLTIDHDKISKWVEVTSEKSTTGTWDS